MLVQTSYSYIKIGLAVRLLRNVLPKYEKDLIRKSITAVKEELELVDFKVSLSFMGSSDFISMLESVNKGDDSSEVGDLSEDIRRIFESLETVLFSEATTKNVYVLPSRRFNADYLLNDPQKLFKDGAFSKLSPLARMDIASACRCILFGESTASAFHILRATEDSLKMYYFLHIKKNRLKTPMWASMITALKAKSRNRPPLSLLDSLDMVRENYRNPTQHPEATYEIDSAQDLFGVCLDLIGKMAKEF